MASFFVSLWEEGFSFLKNRGRLLTNTLLVNCELWIPPKPPFIVYVIYGCLPLHIYHIGIITPLSPFVVLGCDWGLLPPRVDRAQALYTPPTAPVFNSLSQKLAITTRLRRGLVYTEIPEPRGKIQRHASTASLHRFDHSPRTATNRFNPPQRFDSPQRTTPVISSGPHRFDSTVEPSVQPTLGLRVTDCTSHQEGSSTRYC